MDYNIYNPGNSRRNTNNKITMGNIILMWVAILVLYSMFVALLSDGDEPEPAIGIIWAILASPILLIAVPILYFIWKKREKK